MIHHNIYQNIRRCDALLIWLNLLFLMTVALVPFGNDLSLHVDEVGQFAILFFTIDLLFSVVFLYSIWWYATRHHRFVSPTLTPERVINTRQTLQGAMAIFGLVIAVSFINLLGSQLLLYFLLIYTLFSLIVPLRGRTALLLSLSCVVLNVITAVFVIQLHLPLYLDSWATSFAVIISGFPLGLIVGVVSNIVMTSTYWGPESWVWIFSSILIAALTWFYVKKEWISLKKPTKLILAGIITGVLNTGLALILITIFNLPPYEGTYPIFNFFNQITGNAIVSSLIENLCVEILDKTITIFLAAIAMALFVRLQNYDEYMRAYPIALLKQLFRIKKLYTKKEK